MADPYRLLVVDDEAEIRNGMCRYFPWEQVGFTLSGFAENGRQAFEFLLHHPVDAMLCDIRMPGIDGIELARMVREAGLETLIIFFSAHRDFDYARQAINYGVRQYLVKSAKLTEMIQVFQGVRKELDAVRAKRADYPPPSGTAPEPASQSSHARIVAAVTAYVSEHLAENPNLDNMARHVGINPDYLGKIFKVQTGQNFSEFLMRQRMETAAAHLRDIKLKTFEIGALVGYHNPKNFARAFKSWHGLSPRDFRESRPGAVARPEP